MVSLGLMDIGQLLSYYLVFSLMLLTNSNFSDTFSKVSTSLSNATWVGEASMVFILAINRFMKLIFIKRSLF
uniref:NADH dehydrogenase subunit 4L n=1 Tax=Acrobeloides nanus TaxID=290746 RepID=A0A914CPN7_9BILA